MRLNGAVLAGMALTAVTALFFVGGCTSTSTRADLKVMSVNGGSTYYSDLVNDQDTAHIFVPVDLVSIQFSNVPHAGGAPLEPNSGFDEIVVDHYKVTYDNGVYSPVEGGMNVVVPSGAIVDAAVTISTASEKAGYVACVPGNCFSTLPATITATARIDFTGWVRTAGNNGDRVSAVAYLTVQVDDFADQQP